MDWGEYIFFKPFKKKHKLLEQRTQQMENNT